MKKLILTSVFLFAMLSAVPVMNVFPGTLPDVAATDEETKEITYNDMVFRFREDRENELILTGYGGMDETVVVPETDIEICVAPNSFSDSQITELNIDFPCVLEQSAFSNCENLKTVKFKKDATVSSRAFMGCTALENIALDISQTIQGNAFNNCT